MVEERVVLLRVQDLEQRRRRVAPEVGRHLVDLVEQEDRVDRPRLAHHLDDLAREGADVGPAVAADLRLVAHAAERQADELAAGGPRDRLGERRLADARRADEADDRALGLADQLAHGEELEDAVLDLLEAVVVLVEHPLGVVEVLPLLAPLAPGNRHHPVDVVARDGRLGRDRRHRLQALELLLRLLLHVLGQARLLDLLAQLGELVAALVLAPQLLMDGLDLLVEVVLLLGLLHLLLDLHVDPLVDVDLLDLDVEQVVKALQALVGVDQLEQRLLLGGRHHQVGREDVGDAVGVVELQRRHQPLERQVVRHLGVLLEGREDLAHVRPQLLAQRVVDLVGLDLAAEGAVGLGDARILPRWTPSTITRTLPLGSLRFWITVAITPMSQMSSRSGIVDPRILLGGEEDPLGRARRAPARGPAPSSRGRR